MKVSLISFSEEITVLNIRLLSACLKKEGHKTQLIFLRSNSTKSNNFRYNDEILDQVVNLCKDSDLISLTVFSIYFDRSIQITNKLRHEIKLPIIWGGIHPTVRPLQSLEYADMVCVGEGEEAIVDLVNKLEQNEDYYNTKNIWFKREGKIFKNEIRPLIQNLDNIPFPDYDLVDNFVLDNGKLQTLDLVLFKKFLPRFFDAKRKIKINYGVMASRGCPHACSYCCNNALRKIYPSQKYLRRRSAENIINEIMQIRKKYTFIEMISFIDDVFTSMRNDELKKFCDLYKQKVGLPFSCFASPLYINEEKLSNLIDAGLEHIGMGIQTGSKSTMRLYNRHITNNQSIEAAKIINLFKKKIAPPCYDIIIDNPYETNEDYIETFKLLLQIPKPFSLSLFSLVFYPGTELNDKAQNDGIIKDEIDDVYRKVWQVNKWTYNNFLLNLFSTPIPKFILKLLTKKKIIELMNHSKLNGIWMILTKLIGIYFLSVQTLSAIYNGDLLPKVSWYMHIKKLR